MRRFHFKKDGKVDPEGDNMRLQEKLVEKYFQNLDLDEVQPGANTAEFDSQKVYNNIASAINEEAEPVKRGYTKWLVAASLIGVFITLSYYYRYALLNYVSPVHTLEVTASNGNVTNIILGDGTKIWLNGGSTLKYPESFRGSKREITIEGEAFFDVAHDSEKPFIVHTGDISTHVLGTSFNVKAYADESLLKVEVVSGKVGVVASPNSAVTFKTVYLTPAEGIVYNKASHTITKNTTDDAKLASRWKEGKLIFKKTPLPEVIKTLHRKFNYSIKADDNLAACSISADFTNVTMKDIMAVIAKLVNGKAALNGTVYRLTGKGC
jgi:transmembrane sensor